MKPRYIETNLCVHWRHSRCVIREKCPFGNKRVDANGRQTCTRLGEITDNPKFETNAANREYDEMRKREKAKRG